MKDYFNITVIEDNNVYPNACVWDTDCQKEQIETIRKDGVFVDEDGVEYVFGEND